MKSYINYIKESNDTLKNDLIKLSHLNELKISFDFTPKEYVLYYKYKSILYFSVDKVQGEFVVNNTSTWRIFAEHYNLNYFEINDLFENMVENYFKLTDYYIKRIIN